MATRGAFILFEGVDRCGKTTQAKRLTDTLNAAGHKTVFMRFPDRDTTIGKMINAYLTNAAELDDHAVHLLFSANRWEKCASILEALRSGTHVVMDRYAYSGVAFSSAKPGLDVPWCKAPDAGLPRPDVLLFMDLPPEAAAARAGFGGERYEKPDFQKAVRGVFAELQAEADAASADGSSGSGAETGAGAGLWRNINADGTIEAIGEVIKAIALERIEAVKSQPIRQLWDGKELA